MGTKAFARSAESSLTVASNKVIDILSFQRRFCIRFFAYTGGYMLKINAECIAINYKMDEIFSDYEGERWHPRLKSIISMI